MRSSTRLGERPKADVTLRLATAGIPLVITTTYDSIYVLAHVCNLWFKFQLEGSFSKEIVAETKSNEFPSPHPTYSERNCST